MTISKLWESVTNEFKIKRWRVYGKGFLTVIFMLGLKRMQLAQSKGKNGKAITCLLHLPSKTSKPGMKAMHALQPNAT